MFICTIVCVVCISVYEQVSLPMHVALVVQLVERSPGTQSVGGSNPTQGSSSFFLEKKELSWV